MPKNCYRSSIINDRILLIDGLARAGKMLVGPLVGQFPAVEWPRNDVAIDNIPNFWRISGTSLHDCSSLLRLLVNSCVYEQSIGRHINSRATDIYSIYRDLDWPAQEARRFRPDGNDALDAWLSENKFFSFITHHQLPHSELWFEAFPEVRFLITVRHPVDVCASWIARGWGERFGTDRRALTQTADINGKAVPWFAVAFAEQYLAGAPEEKTVRCILALMDMYEQSLNGLSALQRNAVHVVSFEQAATDPERIFGGIANWLGTEFPAKWAVALASERVPRVITTVDRQNKFNDISKQISSSSLEKLVRSSIAYETLWGLDTLDYTRS